MLTALMLFRSCEHLFAPDGGLQSIATVITFEGEPDPDRAIHSLASLQGRVLLRYRNLVPLMLGLLGVEWLGRRGMGLFLHPLGPEFFAQTPPGAKATLPMLVVIAALLALSLRQPPQRLRAECSKGPHASQSGLRAHRYLQYAAYRIG